MPAAEYRRIDADRALAYIFSACEHDRAYSLFDARDLNSYTQSHIPTAQLLVERDIGSWLQELSRAHPVLIYCYHGNASQTLAKTFADFGFGEVYSIDGGFHALVHALQHAYQRMKHARPTPA
jgi:rhodanese-related sulfurtransferase